MRARTVVTFAAGASAGAGAVYLLDPEAGEARRRVVRREALRRAKDGVVVVAKAGAELSRELVRSARQGYQQARTDDVRSQTSP